MTYLGNFLEDSTIDFKWSTQDVVGAAIVRAVDGTMSVYIDNTATPSTTGVTDTESFNSVTGLNHCRIDTSDAFYATGSDFQVVLSGSTIDGQTVVAVIAHFSIENGNRVESTKAQVAAISTVGGGSTGFSANTDNVLGAIKSISFVGVQTSGTFADTATINGYHVIDDTANEIDIVYGFDIGGGKIASDINFEGYLSSANDTLNVLAYNFVTPGWDQIGTLGGQGGTTNQNNTYLLLVRNTGTGADAGLVYIRFQNTGQTNPTLNTDRLLLSAVSNANTIVYEGGAVWLDTNAGNTNTESFVDGTADNPVSTIAAARTIADNLNLKIIHCLPDSSFTLAQSFDGFEIIGRQYTIALGGQSLSGSTIENGIVTGNDDGSNATRTVYRACEMGDNTLGAHILDRCGLGGDIILAEAGTYLWADCRSAVAGTATPSVDVGAAIANTNLNVRAYSGGIELKNFGAAGTDNMSLEGNGQLVLNANCAGGTIAIRGNFTVTDNASGAVTLSDAARYDTLNVMQGAVEGTTTMQDSLKLQNAGNAGKVSGAGTTNVKIRDLADTLDRIDATVDSSGNRTAVTRDLT